jgi:predicted kinase
MRRRAYLALSAALLSGCGRSSQPSETTTSPDYTTVESTERSDTPTETIAETTETTETTAEPTETTSTPDPDPDAASAIDEADGHLVDAVEKYASYAGTEASFLDVTAATTEFATGTISERVADARSALATAEETGTESQKRTIERLREAATFVLNAALLQRELRRSYSDYANGFELIYIDQYSEGVVEDVREAAAAASKHASAVVDRTSPACAEATSAFTREEYVRKREQVRAEARTFELAGAHFVAFDDARADLRAAVNAYDDRKWERAADRFEALVGVYGPMASAVASHEAPEPLDEQFAPFTCDVRALARGCNLLAESASLRAEENREAADERRSESKSAFEECGTLDRLGVLERVY